MEWVSVKNLSLSVVEYHLMDAGNRKATLKYNTQQQVARMNSEDHYAVFFVERTGAFINKTIFKNEYGQEIGKLSFDKRYSHNGPIELEGRKFHYAFQNNPFPELLIYDKNENSVLISSGLKYGTEQSDVVFPSVSNEEYSCLLLGLCWYLMMPLTEKNMAPRKLEQSTK
jgi:hypothetical protein